MNVPPFIAESAVDAVAQIRERLGPTAVVLNVRRLPVTGLSWLWSRPRIEVLACVPEENATHAVSPSESTLLDVTETNAVAVSNPPSDERSLSSLADPATRSTKSTPSRFAMPSLGDWRSGALLEAIGLSPLQAERVAQEINSQPNQRTPESLRGEIALVRDTLKTFWRQTNPARRGLHVFVGPPGSGKTTAICKWLTQSVLLEGASARVWRLDIPRANTAELLSVHCEILNVPLERAWNHGAAWPEEFLFVDFPGIEMNDAAALGELELVLSTMPGASVSLVLNAACEVRILESQVRAFSRLPLSDLIFTHLDEEPRWSKLWNLVLGTNYPLSFLSAGQNIPGQFLRAAPELLFPEAMRVS